MSTHCIAFDLPMLLMYIGPDSFLPLGSALAAIVGFILMFWARVKAFVSRMVQPFRKRRASARRDGTGE